MMVVHRDKVLALEAAGCSDFETARSMRTDAIFDLRSNSKPITYPSLRRGFTGTSPLMNAALPG
jgi:hypothetical protein